MATRVFAEQITAWYPKLRPSILHVSGLTAAAGYDRGGSGGESNNRAARARMVDDVACSSDGVLLTTYEHVRLFRDRLLGVQWGYVVSKAPSWPSSH